MVTLHLSNAASLLQLNRLATHRTAPLYSGHLLMTARTGATGDCRQVLIQQHLLIMPGKVAQVTGLIRQVLLQLTLKVTRCQVTGLIRQVLL